MIKFPKIGQFRNAVRDVRDLYEEPYPTLRFVGTTKVHGTNASVVFKPSGDVEAQSRNRVISVEDDNLGFAAWVEENKELLGAAYRRILEDLVSPDETVVIYGEWAGKGIQHGVAVSELERFFYVFQVLVVDSEGGQHWLKTWPSMDYPPSIIDARKLGEWFIDIDFQKPEEIQNDLIEITNAVEGECPVGKAFQVEGVGEGVVWTHIEDGHMICFKVKGEKHSVTKVKKLAEVDAEKMAGLNAFIDAVVTEQRLEQALQEVCSGDPDRTKLGDFIRWVFNDVIAEESDTMESSGLGKKDIGGALAKAAKSWFFKQEDL